MPKFNQLRPRKSGVTRLSSNANVDAKLTHASMLLEYAFGHGVDFRNRVIALTGTIDEAMFERVDTALTQMEAESKATVTIKINSDGGYVYDALAIVGRLRESKCHVVTVGYGSVMSAATLILACGDRRKISRFAHFMHHEMSYEPGEVRQSTAVATVAHYQRLEELWAHWMEEFTSKPAKFWLDRGRGIDVYFSAEQLLDLGVIDELV